MQRSLSSSSSSSPVLQRNVPAPAPGSSGKSSAVATIGRMTSERTTQAMSRTGSSASSTLVESESEHLAQIAGEDFEGDMDELALGTDAQEELYKGPPPSSFSESEEDVSADWQGDPGRQGGNL